MYPLSKQLHGLCRTSLSCFSHLIDRCLRSKSPNFAKSIHAKLIKVGLISNTFLGNRCLDLYARFGTTDDLLRAFDEIPGKNLVSWNVCLKGLLKLGELSGARKLFDEMPQRDVVSWNSMISGYSSAGLVGSSMDMFLEMQKAGTRPSEFTYSILVSLVSCADHGKQIHGNMVINKVNSLGLVLGNSLIDMYGKLDLLDSAVAVFIRMEEVDIISWNSLILAFHYSTHSLSALEQLRSMMQQGYSPDEFTLSLATTICSNLQDVEKGKQVFALCMKSGFLSNSIVSSAAIDMFSKCDRLEHSIQLFEEVGKWDIKICNSMISSYISHGFSEVGLQLFVRVLRTGLGPTCFTISSLLGAVFVLPSDQGSEIHSLAVKLGFESDIVVVSSLIEMYNRFGLVDSAEKIFLEMSVRDLITWNTIIVGLARYGRAEEALKLFRILIDTGLSPDRITVFGVLEACFHGGFLDQGMYIFSSMKEKHGVSPGEEHYNCIIKLLVRCGKLEESVDLAQRMPYVPSYETLHLILSACIAQSHGDLGLVKMIAEALMTVEPKLVLLLPYRVLLKEYERRGRWEEMVRVGKLMKESETKKAVGSSWIGIRTRMFTFRADQLQHHGGRDLYSILRLLNWNLEGGHN
ncbi:hypothetical protein CDL15_Pgr027931 [Punica granatum]|uniref:Pentatricopeptide repeat-containing protein At1g43980, mitochondrial n=1 Tax=Punica granatum TaxID=22663 RepID=A0A218XJT9_PUNGR|nr:hypothetical protein CDL15_Pgr027931 [Punica granatum]PKI54463.1 hypothetical protein CRG98_025146 [Punica granatum]